MSRFDGFNSVFRRAWDTWSAEVEANPRLIRMMWCIGYLLMGYIIVAIHDQNQMSRQALLSLQAEGSRLSGVPLQSTWETRLEEEELTRSKLLTRCWGARSERLASADVQTRIQEITTNNHLEKSRLTVSKPEAYELEVGQMWFLRVSISGRLYGRDLPPLIRDLEDEEAPFVIERVSFVDARGGGSLSMMVSTCFKKIES
ncbi:MAG: hypothetical protein JJ921_10470 [Pseudomonadales bacterium]|nr:hypothetical protein [Pseudomonadales bacterium]MBO7006546.1 hypothetical protein [Pseudomonadales bacterium]